MHQEKPNLPGYEILTLLGEGESSSVWAARAGPEAPIVAIKWLWLKDPSDESYKRRALEEARAAMRLDHAGIVRLYECGESNGALYFVMEFVEGARLQDLLARKGRLAAKHALQIAEGVALALAYAWDRERLIHRNLCPANIMLQRDGTVRIADLGILWPPEPKPAGMSYAAPEQASESVDYRANIYSLGAILYEMTTGRKPFREETGVEALDRQLFEGLPDPQELNRELTSGFGWFVEKSMIRDPVTRYRTWAEWLADLHEVMQGGWPLSELPVSGQSVVLRSALRFPPPVTASPPPPPPRKRPLRRPAPQRPRVMVHSLTPTFAAATRVSAGADFSRALSTFVILAILVALGYGGLMFYRRAPSPPAPAEAPPESLPQPHIPADKRKMYFEEEAAAPAAAKETTPTSEEVIRWDHPDFVRGARRFNDALALFQRYVQDRRDPAQLKEVERLVREAISAFESCRNEAPRDVPMADLLTQAYRLLSDCRQMMLVPSAATGSEEAD